jgi:hypothetical protein
LPDIIEKIRHDDEQMAARFLGMAFKLGTTETGSLLSGSLSGWVGLSARGRGRAKAPSATMCT